MTVRRAKRPRVARGRGRGPVALWVELFREHELLTYASAIARTMIVAGVALTLLALGVLGAIGRGDLWVEHVAPQIRSRVLPGVYAAVDGTVRHIFAANSPELIVFATLLAIWEVSGSVRGISGALNRVYETPETRSWRVRYPISLAVSGVVVAAVLGAILLVTVAGGLVGGALGVPFGILRWLGAVAILTGAFGVVVRFAPAAPRAQKWATVGAGLVVVGWIIESIAFRWYVTSVANFRTAPGSLAVVLVLVGYLYVGSIILLVGIELDELLREEDTAGERTLAHLARTAASRVRATLHGRLRAST